MIITEALASSRAAEYERILRKAMDSAHYGSKIIDFCKEVVWPEYITEKREAYERIPDDLRTVFEIN
jgi:hypothetical protein